MRAVVLAGLLLSVVDGPARASSAATQAALLKKVLDYDRAAPGRKGAYVVLIIHREASPSVQEVTQEFRKLGVAAILAPVGQLPALIDRAAAAYVMPDAATAEVLQSCAEHHVLTFHGGPELVRAGQVSMGLMEGENGRTDVVVHLGRMKTEGRLLPASVLQVTRVIR